MVSCRYLRPPVTRFRLMDFHFMDRIVRDSNRQVPELCYALQSLHAPAASAGHSQ